METVGNYTCRCHPGFQGPRCQEGERESTRLSAKPSKSQRRFVSFSQQSHASPCWIQHQRSSAASILTDSTASTPPAVSIVSLAFAWRARPGSSARPAASGATLFLCVEVLQQWFYQPLERRRKRTAGEPTHACACLLSVSVQKCPVLEPAHLSAGSISCSPPQAPNSYNSTCELRCDRGYEASGQQRLRCEHTGRWTASVPACTSKDLCCRFMATYARTQMGK